MNKHLAAVEALYETPVQMAELRAENARIKRQLAKAIKTLGQLNPYGPLPCPGTVGLEEAGCKAMVVYDNEKCTACWQQGIEGVE